MTQPLHVGRGDKYADLLAVANSGVLGPHRLGGREVGWIPGLGQGSLHQLGSARSCF
jgi:hypothetical protein